MILTVPIALERALPDGSRLLLHRALAQLVPLASQKVNPPASSMPHGLEGGAERALLANGFIFF